MRSVDAVVAVDPLTLKLGTDLAQELRLRVEFLSECEHPSPDLPDAERGEVRPRRRPVHGSVPRASVAGGNLGALRGGVSQVWAGLAYPVAVLDDEGAADLRAPFQGRRGIVAIEAKAAAAEGQGQQENRAHVGDGGRTRPGPQAGRAFREVG